MQKREIMAFYKPYGETAEVTEMDDTPREETPKEENLDAIVDHLLRDQAFLLSKEIRHKIEELNQVLIAARGQKMKVEFEVVESEMPSGGTVSLLDAKIYKEI